MCGGGSFADDLNQDNEELSTLQKSLVEKVRAFAKTQNFDLMAGSLLPFSG
jgi:hypothetical protein